MKPYYNKAGVQIYHGDCRELLSVLPTAGLVLTDPPYGIGVTKMRLGNRTTDTFLSSTEWTDEPISEDDVRRLLVAGTDQIIFGGTYMSGLPKSRGWIVWDKNNGASSFADGELIWTSYDQPLRIIKVHWVGSAPKWEDTKAKVHPTQKPVALLEYLIRIKLPRTLIDPYMGSGSTLVAAQKLGVACIGIERSEAYCEIAANRCNQQPRR